MPINRMSSETSGYIVLCRFLLRVRKDLLRVAKLHHLPHIEKRRLITDTCSLLHIVRHNHNGIPFFQLVYQLFHLCRRNRVERRSRFVHQQHRRRYSHCACDTKTLLLSAGQGKSRFFQFVLHFIPKRGDPSGSPPPADG